MSLQFLRLSKRAIFGLTIALLMLAAQPAKAQWPDVVEAKSDRRGRLHLRPADRDELRGDVRVRRGHAIPGSSRRRSTRSTTRRASSPTRTRRSSRPTATRPIPSSGWTCAPSRSSCPSRRWRRTATTRCSLTTATPTTTATSAAAPPATRPATTWWSAPTGRARRPPGIKKVFRSTTQFSSPATAPNSSIPTTCRMSRRSRPATRCSRCRRT